MAESQEWTYDGHHGSRVARTWPNPDARYVALLCHGYGEHIGRYEHVADALVEHGAVVHGVDHIGHGKSDGERVLVDDFEQVVRDFHLLGEHAAESDPGLPVVLIGHSMGGMIAARYAQRYGRATGDAGDAGEVAAVVLSGPVLGRWDAATSLLELEEIPDAPIDPDTLSRDPAVGKAYVDDPLVWHGRFRRSTLKALVRCLETIRAGGDLGDLPTLWVHGEDDQLVPIDGTRSGIETLRGPRFTERTYPEARHEVFNETNRDEVLHDVARFIDRALEG
jgi:alpha-beta hydrolase superfamily lysophospholipase